MTEPLVQHYEESEAPVLRVDGDQAPDTVRKALWQALVENLHVET
jgi:hypothetical protein